MVYKLFRWLFHQFFPTDQIKTRFNVTAKIFDANGKHLRTIKTRNLVVDSGLNANADMWGFPDQLYSVAYTPNYIALDSSSSATTAGMTAPVSEIATSRKLITRKIAGNKNIVYEQYYSTTECNGSSIYGVCLMSALVGGTMFARATHSLISKNASISILYIWGITFGAA